MSKDMGPPMAVGDAYRLKAAEFQAMAEDQKNVTFRMQFESLARAYLRLAEQAERNIQTDVTYEPPSTKIDDLDAPDKDQIAKK